MICITTPSFAIMVNGGPFSFFKASKGLRQGNSLSPVLFFIVMEALSRLIEWACEIDLLKGVIVGGGVHGIEVSHFFFANDILIFCQPEIRMILNLWCVLLCF